MEVEYGREPLVTLSRGCLSKSTIREYCYPVGETSVWWLVIHLQFSYYMTTVSLSNGSLYQIAEQKPLAHPGTASVSLVDFDTTPPEHLRDIYGSVYRAMHRERYPNAPKKLGFILPREHGKSEAGSHVIPTWAALRDPNVRVLLMSETPGQAKNKLNECRTTINKLGPRFARKIETDNSRELTLERDANHDVAT